MGDRRGRLRREGGWVLSQLLTKEHSDIYAEHRGVLP